jgi:heme-degrading monooxygenase HmoA
MISVLFDVSPKADLWETYLGYATMLRTELEQIDGFVDNVRYASLTRKDWILSLSGWDTEKALVRWRTRSRHHEVQEKGRGQVLVDYHLRVGQVTGDSRLPDGHRLVEQRLDETEVGEGTTVTLIDAPPTSRLGARDGTGRRRRLARPRSRRARFGVLGRVRRRAEPR